MGSKLVFALASAFLSLNSFAHAATLPLVARTAATSVSDTWWPLFERYSHYASAAYCPSTQITNWDCTGDCILNDDGSYPLTLSSITTGGDGVTTPYWYVGYDSSQYTIIVAHQGSTYDHIHSIVTDPTASLTAPNSSIFSNVPPTAQILSTFKNYHEATITAIDAAVIKATPDPSTMPGYGTAHVKTYSITTVGHSLGGVLALLDAVHFRSQTPTRDVRSYTYGMPRIGNNAFATYIDANIGTLYHINHKEDPIPLLPPTPSYAQPSNELHITADGPPESWWLCPGHDNTDPHCIAGDTSPGKPSDHAGPYDGITMGCKS